jgi:hypothetical protein
MGAAGLAAAVMAIGEEERKRSGYVDVMVMMAMGVEKRERVQRGKKRKKRREGRGEEELRPSEKWSAGKVYEEEEKKKKTKEQLGQNINKEKKNMMINKNN